MRVEVTRDDIATGVKGSATQCPVGIALNRHGLHGAAVDCSGVYYEGFWIAIPQKVVYFMDSFDGGKNVQPLTFKLDTSSAREKQNEN